MTLAEINEKVAGVMAIFNTFMDGIWTAMDRGRVSRRAVHYTVLVLTVSSYVWTLHFITTTGVPLMAAGKLSETGFTAACVAALGPITALQGWSAKLYTVYKSKAEEVQ